MKLHAVPVRGAFYQHFDVLFGFDQNTRPLLAALVTGWPPTIYTMAWENNYYN
jgi:hypothetical protein